MFYRAQVLSITEQGREESAGFADAYQVALLKVVTGPDVGEVVTVRYTVTESLMKSQQLYEGDTVVVVKDEQAGGTGGYQVIDHYRLPGVLIIAVAFVMMATVLGKMRGLASLFGLALSVLALVGGVIPLILQGYSPIWVSLIGASAVAIVSMIFAHGWNRRSWVAIMATMGTLVVAFAASAGAVVLARLTGVSSDDATVLQLSYLPLTSLRDILLASMVIGTLGVLDDVTTAQVAAVEEIADAGGNRFSAKELYRRGLSVGREHIASLVNTLALAYAGAAFPTLILLSVPDGPPLWVILNGEFIMVEVVRALVGGMALMLAVPISTALAAGVVAKYGPTTYGSAHHRH